MSKGHNRTGFEASQDALETLETEARNWLDGEPITTQGQADDVAKLIDQARNAAKQAEEAREAEKKPHADAAKAVDEKFKPVAAGLKKISDGAKALLAPWLQKIEREKVEAAAKAAKEKAEAEEALREAREQADPTDLESVEVVEQAEADAKEAAIAERVANKGKASAKGGARAVGLRTYYSPKITDRKALLNHILKTDRSSAEAFIEEWARKSFARGVRSLPGVEVIEEKRAA